MQKHSFRLALHCSAPIISLSFACCWKRLGSSCLDGTTDWSPGRHLVAARQVQCGSVALRRSAVTPTAALTCGHPNAPWQPPPWLLCISVGHISRACQQLANKAAVVAVAVAAADAAEQLHKLAHQIGRHVGWDYVERDLPERRSSVTRHKRDIE